MRVMYVVQHMDGAGMPEDTRRMALIICCCACVSGQEQTGWTRQSVMRAD